jgi:hypothetical protein
MTPLLITVPMKQGEDWVSRLLTATAMPGKMGRAVITLMSELLAESDQRRRSSVSEPPTACLEIKLTAQFPSIAMTTQVEARKGCGSIVALRRIIRTKNPR